MLAFLFSWIVIFTILFSFGDASVWCFNKFGNRSENYNIFDLLILGMCFLIIPLSLWSLFLPTDHFFLLIVIPVCIGYWIVNRNRINKYIQKIKSDIKRRSSFEIILLIGFTCVFLIHWVWPSVIMDSMVYHYQAIRWNEEYSVIPGLGNIEDRLAFNSNYFLFSSLFTFRFLFGIPVYSFQGFFILFFSYWIIMELFRSCFEIKRIILFVLFLIYYIVSFKLIRNTSTDILPNILVFYMVAKYLFYRNLHKTNTLLLFVVPALLFTLKVSFAAFLIVPFILSINFIKEKKSKRFLFLMIYTFLIVAFWLTRNVILSGYLLYPFYQLDLFSFDWKMPVEFALSQQECIRRTGEMYLRNTLQLNPVRDPFPAVLLNITLYIFLLISVSIYLINLFKVGLKKLNYYSIIFFMLIITVILWYFNGPDARFVHGVIAGLILLGFSSFFLDKENITFPAFGKISMIGVFAFVVLSVFPFLKIRFNETVRDAKGNTDYSFIEILYKPYTLASRFDAHGVDIQSSFRPYSLNNGIVINVSDLCFTFDNIPSSTETECEWKIPDYKWLEARGGKIENGFRIKKDVNFMENKWIKFSIEKNAK